jgi:hypothetical protein
LVTPFDGLKPGDGYERPLSPRTKKADVAEHPKVFGHVGLLFNKPPSTTGLFFSQSSDCSMKHYTAGNKENKALGEDGQARAFLKKRPAVGKSADQPRLSHDIAAAIQSGHKERQPSCFPSSLL